MTSPYLVIRTGNPPSWGRSFDDIQRHLTGSPVDHGLVACATSPTGDTHILAAGALNAIGPLFHTIRFANGSWAPVFGNVFGAVPNNQLQAIGDVACSTNYQ